MCDGIVTELGSTTTDGMVEGLGMFRSCPKPLSYLLLRW
jgi:hypothetical protein